MAHSLQDGIALFQQGDLDGAAAIFQQLIEINPANASAHLWMGNYYVLDGDLRRARVSFQAAKEHGDEEMGQEAKRQIWSLWYNRMLNRLMFQAPLRYLLLAAAIGYGLAYLLRYLGWVPLSKWIHWISVGGLLPLFFIWAMFIISCFVGNIAFESQGAGARNARIVIILCGVLVLPANLLIGQGVFVLLLALAIDIFLISLLLSRLINWFGHRLAQS